MFVICEIFSLNKEAELIDKTETKKNRTKKVMPMNFPKWKFFIFPCIQCLPLLITCSCLFLIFWILCQYSLIEPLLKGKIRYYKTAVNNISCRTEAWQQASSFLSVHTSKVASEQLSISSKANGVKRYWKILLLSLLKVRAWICSSRNSSTPRKSNWIKFKTSLAVQFVD